MPGRGESSWGMGAKVKNKDLTPEPRKLSTLQKIADALDARLVIRLEPKERASRSK